MQIMDERSTNSTSAAKEGLCRGDVAQRAEPGVDFRQQSTINNQQPAGRQASLRGAAEASPCLPRWLGPSEISKAYLIIVYTGHYRFPQAACTEYAKQSNSLIPSKKTMSKLSHHLFPPSVIDKLSAYVYGLLAPRTEPPTLFYIGKGKGNRVFEHAADALVDPTDSDKLELIGEILKNHEVQTVILRHGLSDAAAFDVECALIDLCRHVLHFNLTNVQGVHRSDAFGVMTTDEIIRKYQAQPLEVLEQDCVLININNSYRRAKGAKSYYEATRGDWKMDKIRHPLLKYALSEYRGFIVEVFAINKWSERVVTDKSGKERKRWRFEGAVAPDEVRNLYLNRSVQKKKGAAFPLRYNYSAESLHGQ